MKTKNIRALFAFLPIIMLLSCNPSATKKEPFNLSDFKDVVNYPTLFSYASDSLAKELNLKVNKPLTQLEKATYFRINHQPEIDNDSLYIVFPLHRIRFETSTLLLFLVRENQTSSFHGYDYLVQVIYNNEGQAINIFSENLEDFYSSTSEVKYTSRSEFEVIYTDNEYSPDPESEAEHLKNGYIPEPSIRKTSYYIDTIACKFINRDPN